MSNFIDYKIGNRVSSQFRRVVTGKTDIVTMASGREMRNAAWKFKKMSYTASYAMLTPEAQEAIVSAFYACNAQLMLFRFRDPGDFIAVESPLFDAITGHVGSTDAIQLTKRYTFGPAYADRVIQAVSTCTVLDHTGTPVAGTFDSELGLFTPTSPWGSNTYSWTGTFDVWVRFNNDDLDISMLTFDIATSDVELIEALANAS